MKKILKLGLAGLLIAGAAAVVLPARPSGNPEPTVRKCQAKLVMINNALAVYNSKFREYPDKLSRLYLNSTSNTNIFVCPGTDDKIEDKGSVEEIRESIDANTSYNYFKPNEYTKPDDIILADKRLSNHDGVMVIHGYGRKNYFLMDEYLVKEEIAQTKIIAGGIGAGAGLLASGLIGYFVKRRKIKREQDKR